MKAPVAIALLFLPSLVSAQLIAYESFAGLPIGSGLTGSGIDASGWSDAGWAGGTDARFQIVDPLPNLAFESAGGRLTTAVVAPCS
jgi:hypothetical protein